MKALPLSIFEDKRIGNCSNNGISSRYNEVLLICEEGFIEIDPENPPENAVKIGTIQIGYKVFKHIVPLKKPDKGCVGWMSGGTFAYSSDSRFRKISEYPLSIHDRQETQKEYDSNFR